MAELGMVVIVFLIFSACAAWGSDAGEGPPLNPALFGEKNFELYFGPLEPAFRVDERYGRVVFEEQDRASGRFYHNTQRELGAVAVFFKDLEAARVCPNSELARHYDYIRYLYRLSALSYLRESLERLNEVAQKMKFGAVCKADLPKILNQCAPQGEDMKLFVKSAKVLSQSFETPETPYNFPFESFYDEWLKQFQKGALTKPSHQRMSAHFSLNANTKKLQSLSRKQVRAAFKRVCQQDVETFQKICSEKDELYGMSRVNEAFHVIASSEALKVINEQGNGRGCLARFASLMRDKEIREESLEQVFPAIYSSLRQKGRFGQVGGKLFPAGSLKLFAQNGLEDIFIERPKAPRVSNAELKEEKEVEIELAPLAPAPLKKILKPKAKKKEKLADAASPPPKPKPKKSHFLSSSETRKQFDLETVKLDMLKFKYDYVFSPKMLNFLDGQVSKFASRKGLEEMREFDALGTKKGPVPLLFIKYLIEQDNYQGLFNLLETVGEEFYVKNNIDSSKISEPYNYIQLKFEEDADFKWQILIKRAPNTNGRE